MYGIHDNSIPFPHRDLAAAYLTSLSLPEPDIFTGLMQELGV